MGRNKIETISRPPTAKNTITITTFIKPVLSQQCSAALQSLKVAFQAELSVGAAEKAAGTEGTAGDVTEDKTEMARFAPLFQSIRANCTLGTAGAFTWFGSTRTLSFQD